MTSAELCGYRMAYIYQPCMRNRVPGETACEKHLEKKCWCGEQAVKECSIASSFVCGAPLCADHECRNVAGGLTGSHGFKHSEKGHQQFLDWKEKE